MLFEARGRTRIGPRAHAEPVFNYLDSSAEPRVEAVRQALNGWFRHYPAGDGRRFIGEFRSKDDRQCLGAFWELYLHESFRRLGFEIDCHPSIAGSDYQPDFRVTYEGTAVYVEARLVGPSDSVVAAQRREATVRDALEKVNSDHFFLSVTLVEAGPDSPSGRRLRNAVESWLRTLDADAALEVAQRNPSELSSKQFSLDGWKLDVTAYPVPPEQRGLPRRAIGVYGPTGVTLLDTAAAIRDRLHKKSGKYEGLDAPLMPALLVRESTFADHDDVAAALYGTTCVRYELHPRQGTTPSTGGWARLRRS
jgi:hypothetical protein